MINPQRDQAVLPKRRRTETLEGSKAKTGLETSAKLPLAFALTAYLAHNPDLSALTPEQATDHYERWGRAEGRVCSTITGRTDFLALVPRRSRLLEIGPYTAPAFRKPGYNVCYLDAFTSAELRAKAAATGMDAAGVPEIDYVWHGEEYAELIHERMAAVFSSHNIEHQPDLIRHLRQLHRILKPSGRLFFAIPDRRYCFDHYIPDTNFADVFGAYYEARQRHTAASIFEHRMLTTHNEAGRHWAGDHGPPPLAQPLNEERIAIVHETMRRIEASPGYIDTHAWQFTPHSFRALIDTLALSGMIPFRTERVYETIQGSNEFYAVLKAA